MKTMRLLWAVMAISLGACSSLDGKTAHEMVKVSAQRSLTQDSQYNFAGEMQVSGRELTQEELSRALTDHKGSLIGMAADAMKEYPAMGYYLEQSRIKMTGAVDLPAQKVELIPEWSVQARNDHASMRMPILFDGNDMSVTVDMPVAVPIILNFLVEPAMRARLVHEPIRFTLADASKKSSQQPIKTAIQAAWIASSRAYQDMPAEQFQLLPLDAFAQESGAKYRIGLQWTTQNQQAYFKAFTHHWGLAFDRLQQEQPEPHVNAQAYQNLRAAMMKWAQKWLIEEDWLEPLFGQNVMRNLYLDGKGRLVGYRDYGQSQGKKQVLNVETRMKLFNFGKPKFSFQPVAEKSISLAELLKSIQIQRTNK